MKSLAVLLSLPALLCFCSTIPASNGVQGVPEWVRRPEVRYPSERFLSSVGVGRDRESAILDAKKNMAESFLVKVKSASVAASESSVSKDTDGMTKGASEDSFKKEVTFESMARLRGAEVKEVESVGAEVYALLALDRLSARSGLLLEVNRIKSKLEAELQALEEGYSTATYLEARKDLQELRDLSSEASVLGMAALLPLDSLENRFVKVEAGIRERNRNLRFKVNSLKGDDRFARALETCIQDQGGTILAEDVQQEGAGRISLSVSERPQHMEVPGWVRIRFDVSATLVRADGKSIRINESRTETARSKEAALEAVSDEISKRICEQAWNRLGELK